MPCTRPVGAEKWTPLVLSELGFGLQVCDVCGCDKGKRIIIVPLSSVVSAELNGPLWF